MRSARSSWFESTVAWVRQRVESMRPEEVESMRPEEVESMRPEEVADAVTFFALAR